MSDTKHTEHSITALLANKHSGSDWAFCSQVPNGTGTAKSRTADALAMCLWPSKGLHLHGFEIKVNRSDWLKEIQDVSKASAFARYCHYWWIVAPKGVVNLEEMPSDWGLVIAGKSLRNKKAATLRDPDSPDHSLLAGIFRACSKQSGNKNAIDAAYQMGRSDAFDEATKRAKDNLKSEETFQNRELMSLKKSVAEFEGKSGIRITTWNGCQMGKLFNIAQSIQDADVSKICERTKQTLSNAISSLDAAIEKSKSITRESEE